MANYFFKEKPKKKKKELEIKLASIYKNFKEREKASKK